ncbi:MAG: helix-turn-helix domain-containing protein [Treponema sp.]|jgi:transcriptional regulator with XRE-family HTH domain|nr:helix-turn-helix domain-containing protein [Treponema sp.]
MEKRPIDLRKTLSINIKNQRALLGLSQEKLAENAGISSNMVRDIEGCRTWVSDITLINIAAALKTDTYRLLMPETIQEDENYRTVLLDLIKALEKTQSDFAVNIANTLKLWGIKKGL